MRNFFLFVALSLSFSISLASAIDWKTTAFGVATGVVSGKTASEIAKDQAVAFAKSFIGSMDLYESNVKKINEGLTDFSKELGFTVSQAATQQNVWPDAYIGKLYPSYPVHFGFGVNAGVAHMDTSGIAHAADVLGIKKIKNDYYFPVINADARIGGLFLPFDVGFSFFKLNNAKTSFLGCNFALDLYTIGFDVRYALFREDSVWPTVSLGGGFFYNHGEFSASGDAAEASIEYNVKTAYGQVQISKRYFNLITPFVGFRGSVSSYKNKWSWSINDMYAEEVYNSAKELNVEAKTKDSNTVSSSGMKLKQLQPQVFGGIAIKHSYMQATLSVTADLRNLTDYGLWSGSFSIRFKL